MFLGTNLKFIINIDDSHISSGMGKKWTICRLYMTISLLYILCINENFSNLIIETIFFSFIGASIYICIIKYLSFSSISWLLQLAKSNEFTVALRSVKNLSSGVYRCEVSGDAPLFHTGTGAAKMIVVQMPDSNPTIKLHDAISPNDYIKKISIGDKIRARCSSGASYPSVNFTWSINGNRLPVNM